jgi:hypothetical protein
MYFDLSYDDERRRLKELKKDIRFSIVGIISNNISNSIDDEEEE